MQGTPDRIDRSTGEVLSSFSSADKLVFATLTAPAFGRVHTSGRSHRPDDDQALTAAQVVSYLAKYATKTAADDTTTTTAHHRRLQATVADLHLRAPGRHPQHRLADQRV